METPVFKNKFLQAELENQGFVKVPFWDDATVGMIRQKYESAYKSRHISTKHFHTTYETVNIELINEVRDFLQPLFIKSTEFLFDDMVPVSASFLVKESNPESASPLHQDASFVDEPKHRSVSVWVALEDIGIHNGCLQFLPGSHRLFTGIRYIPYSNAHIENYATALQPFLTQHTIKLGEAFVFYNAVVHTSPPNQSSTDRVIPVMGFYNKAAQLSLYLKNESTHSIDRYAITSNQLAEINATFKPLSEQFIDSHPFPEPITMQKVNDFVRNNYPLLKRLKTYFSLQAGTRG